MKKILFTLIVLSFVYNGINSQTQSHNLMPVPGKLKFTGKKFRINENFKAGITGGSSIRVEKGVNRMLKRLAGRTGLFFENPFVLKGINEDSVDMSVSFADSVKVKLFMDEAYGLNVSENKITLSARSDIGILRGLETLLQLMDSDSAGYYFHGVKINDAPRFPWRGLMIDVCRHFMPIDVIYRNLDAMAAVKMNVLHLHLSEDQGFRIECKTFPKLHLKASDGFYFTQEQIKDIIKYADERGIRVVPEFDIPGHATSWLVAYPEYASMPGPYKLQRGWGIFDPVFDPTKEQTYEFFDEFFKEMTALFPDDYFHIGGDENNGKHWKANERIQKFMNEHGFESTSELQAYFNKKISKILSKYNKNMIGWDEILEPGIPKNIVIQSWRGKEGLIKAARNGYYAILSNGYYIDLIQPTDFHYLNDPLPEDIELTDDEKKYVLGGEATMWSEFVSPETIDSRIWPRTAAIAERLWSPQHVKNIDDMYRRLETVSFRLEELGVTHIKNYGMMLRRLTNNQDISALKTLVDVLEPVKIYKRNSLRRHFQQSPLTRVVDAARPDQKVARIFRKKVVEFVSTNDIKIRNFIEDKLKIWSNNHSKVEKLSERSPVLNEIIPQSKNLRDISTIGLQAIDFIKNKNVPSAEWIDLAKKIIEKAKLPVAQTELMIVEGIEKLVETVLN